MFRVLTGIVVFVASLSLVVFVGFMDGPGIDYPAIISGVFGAVLGVIIVFNDKEDNIEQIKRKK